MQIVALSGKIGSGKSFVADYLVREHGFKKFSYAARLKEDIMSMGFSMTDIIDKPEWMRLLLQAYGKAWRAKDPDHWANIVMDQIDWRVRGGDLFDDDVGKIVIDDMRFRNEAELLRSKYLDPNVCLLRLALPDDQETKGSFMQDESERDLDHYDGFKALVQVPHGETDLLCEWAWNHVMEHADESATC